MKKVILCYTASNADSDWFEKDVMLDESNYKDVIDDYIKDNEKSAIALQTKWEINGDGDPLYLNFRMFHNNPELFRLIDQYMETYLLN
jgi:hypothetical protein